MKWLAVLMTLALVASCGPGQPTYLDQVRSLGADKAHPLLQQLIPLLTEPGRNPDELMRTWKEFLADTPLPLRQDGNMTFVYYDFTHGRDSVFLEASFAPRRKEPLTRLGKTGLFYRVYAVPKPTGARYRFSTGTEALPDPFHSDLLPGDELWHPLVDTAPSEPAVQWVSGNTESMLEGQDLHILLPPAYQRNLAWTYPLVIVVGLDGSAWTRPLEQMMQDGSIRPVVTVSVGNPGSLKTVLEDRVVPWMRSHYRVSPLASELVVIGWGQATKEVVDLAAARPDFWTKSWVPMADQARGEDAWNTLAPPFFRTQFAVVTP